MVYLTFVAEFNAFHRMASDALTDEANLATFGKCANPSGHGHRYRLEITVKGQVSQEKPFVMKRTKIENTIEKIIAPKFDHTDLNSIFGVGFISSGENLAREVWKLLEKSLDGAATLVFVKVIETNKNAFGYGGPHPSRIQGTLF